MNANRVYFTQYEKELILALMKPHLHIIECRETNAVSNIKKKEAYIKITQQFNDTDGVVNPRTPQQIRQCYLNLKKKMSKKNSVLRQERRQTRGVEVKKEAELTEFEVTFLEEPIPTLPLSTPFDSDSTDIEFSKPQYPSTSTSASLIPPVTPSQNLDKITEYDSSSDSSNTGMENDLNPTPKKAMPLKETLEMFRKSVKTPTAPSAAAKAAACIEEEHRIKIRYMEMDEERKNEEHKLRMELLMIKIALAKEKMEAQKILITTLKGSPKIYLQNTE
ncbi:myb_DNA-bind_5 domain-containing protein [Trichonephila inaurata madagascariensis]|uniref:Regulatory protein zeste n=1 Tax=Trichonephila inaurata madagascariensis TaxID=2747483 RepID=A0A8X6YDM2_9ARAC|nr:myb_DNA-bind_5 domain-containing protein [Trichonephila inaurata madagascariensis]